jgi:hypothetical protein
MFSDVGAVYANHHTVHSEIIVGIELRLSQIYESAFRGFALLTIGENQHSRLILIYENTM